MSGNPLVVGPVDTSTATSGAGVVDDLVGLNEALSSGSWLAVGLSGVGTALDAVATASDPLGSLIAAGLGWLMDHLQPLRGWLDHLTGDPGAVLGYAGTWENVAKAMGNAGDELTRVVRADLEAMTGQSVSAYGAYADKLADHIRAGGGSAAAMASALRVCGQVVQAVHDLVRDTLSQLVGSIVSWAAEAVFSFGLATPWIVEQVSTRVSSLAARIGTKVKEVVQSAAALHKLLDALKEMLARVAPALRRGAKTGEHGGAGDALPADINRFPPKEQINKYFDKVPSKPGYFDVGLHGSPSHVFLPGADGTTRAVDHRLLAEMIRRAPDYDGGPVRLLSCKTGASPDGFAQRLADALGVEVEAPTDTLWIWPNGATGVGPKPGRLTGGWTSFTPGGGRP